MPVKIDIIILSYAKTELLKQITLQGIESLFLSEDPDHIQFEALVIESNAALFPYQYPNTKTIYPDEKFGFNKYLNIGIAQTDNAYICLCNNDLIYHQNWASEILSVMEENPNIKSANPYCSYFHPQLKIAEPKKIVVGTTRNLLNGILTGWCIFLKREIFDTIGLLDEQFEFWYADKDFGRTLLNYKIDHALIIPAKVDHLGNQTHTAINEKKLSHLTHGQKIIFEKKWGKEPVALWPKVKNLIKRLLND
ncbi:glycosyltransferase family 2 protein [Pedobacter sp. WC2423]|uniref:glycosyltransferase family 2 protein n=1 Tax=Pedobacter sp. WC2423 TaxID=3234142 RepID=UPI003466DCBF